MKRAIQIAGQDFQLSLNRPVQRYPNNPILTSHEVNKVWTDPRHQVVTVHNAGITTFDDEVLMLFRSHLRNGISVIGMARSKDGISNWEIAAKPLLVPCTADDHFAPGSDAGTLIENEAGGVEDPRIAKIGDTYFITYSAYHGLIKDRVRVSLATTHDFKSITRHGPVLEKDMRNVVIFPEKIQGKYYALMRPNDDPKGNHTGGIFKEILLASTYDLMSNKWEVEAEPVHHQADGPSAFSDKIGPGATPLKTPHGWLSIFHGVRATMDGNPYVLGVAMHESTHPTKVKISNIPILFPSQADCRVSANDYVHVPNVVFSCGALRQDDGTVMIYYGGNDTVMNVAFSHEDILAEMCNRFPQDPHTGAALYSIF